MIKIFDYDGSLLRELPLSGLSDINCLAADGKMLYLSSIEEGQTFIYSVGLEKMWLSNCIAIWLRMKALSTKAEL